MVCGRTLTVVAAVAGAVGSLGAGAGLLVASGKLDRLAGRVDCVEATLRTLMVGVIRRPSRKWVVESGRADAGRDAEHDLEVVTP